MARATGRRAFTMIELLGVMTIIGILMIFILVAASGAQRDARQGDDLRGRLSRSRSDEQAMGDGNIVEPQGASYARLTDRLGPVLFGAAIGSFVGNRTGGPSP